MVNKISLIHIGDQKFDIHQHGHIIRLDATSANVSTGVRPKALILSSLAGCTAIDMEELLRKMRVEFSEFRIEVSGELTEEHPKTYHTVYLTYFIKILNSDDKSKVERAVSLSQETYCGVSAMIRKFADIKVSIEYL